MIILLTFTRHGPHMMLGWLVWDKGQRKFSLADAELAWTNQKKATRICTLTRGEMATEDRMHPTQKPIRLMIWTLDRIDAKGGVFVDPFMGSGTTGVACIRTQRRFIGIEIERKYWEIAVERCKRELGRFPLFEQTRPKQTELFSDRP
jgi:DNA modification methylase